MVVMTKKKSLTIGNIVTRKNAPNRTPRKTGLRKHYEFLGVKFDNPGKEDVHGAAVTLAFGVIGRELKIKGKYDRKNSDYVIPNFDGEKNVRVGEFGLLLGDLYYIEKDEKGRKYLARMPWEWER